MLQIVIWMGCVYLVVKGLGIIAQPERRNGFGISAAIIAFLAAPAFFLIAQEQVNQIGPLRAFGGIEAGRSGAAPTEEDLNALSQEAQEVSDESNRLIAEAERMLQNAE